MHMDISKLFTKWISFPECGLDEHNNNNFQEEKNFDKMLEYVYEYAYAIRNVLEVELIQ